MSSITLTVSGITSSLNAYFHPKLSWMSDLAIHAVCWVFTRTIRSQTCMIGITNFIFRKMVERTLNS